MSSILIAEDNKFTAMQYVKFLETQGHSIDITSDGNECVKKFKDGLEDNGNSRYDFVVVDHSMPNKNGADTSSEILNLNPEQKIIFASAYSLSCERNFSQLKSKVTFLQKPFSLSKLAELVEN